MTALTPEPVPFAVDTLATAWSASLGVDERTVRSRTLLNLLQYDAATAANPEVIQSETKRSARWAAERCEEERWRLHGPPLPHLDASSALFHAIEEHEASRMIRAFHFLGYSRAAQACYGVSILTNGCWRLIAVVVLSPLDLDYLRPYLGEGTAATMVVTRLYSLPWAPRNTLTFLLGSVRRHLNKTASNTTLLTFCNPNAGHRGTIYRAAGWSLFARQPQRHLYYRDGEYVSVRQARNAIAAGSVLSMSRQPLQDLLIFVRGADGNRQSATSALPYLVQAPAFADLGEPR
jgi:hypothetical protein